MAANQIKISASVASLIILLVGIMLLTGLTRTKPRNPTPGYNALPVPETPGPITHAPGATDLVPGLNTNPNNDPTPAAFQYGTGSDDFDGQTGEGSGPAGTARTAALHAAFVQTAAQKRPAAAATPTPTGSLQAVRSTPAVQKAAAAKSKAAAAKARAEASTALKAKG